MTEKARKKVPTTQAYTSTTMAKMVRKKLVPRIPAYTAAGPSFLGLPVEVRIMIYRLLLVADKPLGSRAGNGLDELEWAWFGEYHLHPAILRVSWQLHQEASPMLNGENTFGIQIYGFDWNESEAESDFGFDDVFTEKWEVEMKPLFMDFELNRAGLGRGYFRTRIQRIEIVIDTTNLDLKALGLDVENLGSSILCNMPALQHLSLYLVGGPFDEINHQTLRPFGILRNMRSVVIKGVPLPFAGRLKGLMLGNTPQVKVKEMYTSLESYVNGRKGHSLDL